MRWFEHIGAVGCSREGAYKMLIVLARADVAFRSVAGCRTVGKVFDANGEMFC